MKRAQPKRTMTEAEIEVGLHVVERRPWWTPKGQKKVVARRGVVRRFYRVGKEKFVELELTVGARSAADLSLRTFLSQWDPVLSE